MERYNLSGAYLLSGEIYLNEKQYAIVSNIYSVREIEVRRLAEKLNVTPESLMRDLAELEKKELVKMKRQVLEKIFLTDEGREVIEKGLPEERIYRVMYKCLEREVKEFLECVSREANIDNSHARIGLQYLLREHCLEITSKKVVIGEEENCFRVLENASWLKSFLKNIERGEHVPSDIVGLLKRRRMVRVEKKTAIIVCATNKLIELYNKGLIKEKKLVTVVKPSMAHELDKYIIKEFDLSIPPPRPRGAKINSYMEFLDMVRDILVSMGFEEVKGPHVELEFWNFDALFQAQDHPAREIHDTFFVENKLKGRVPEELLERAKAVHERGWRYKWDPLRALRPVLRTQTTAVSVRAIFEKGEGEYRVFCLDRVFRPETLDAKHSMEFYQLDGIIVGRNVNFKHLLAFFKEFAAALGIKQVWFKPGYFPFTEPSVEGFIKHPELGWIEVFPGGVFRPEVLEILGVKNVRAIAWGIGIDRLAMTVLGLNDIRDLFNKDIDFLRKLPIPKLPYFTSKTSGKEVDVVKTPL